MIEINDRDRLASFYATFYRPAAEARGIGPELLLEACKAGVGDALEMFDPAAGRSFQAHAASHIRRRIATCLAGRVASGRRPPEARRDDDR